MTVAFCSLINLAASLMNCSGLRRNLANVPGEPPCKIAATVRRISRSFLRSHPARTVHGRVLHHLHPVRGGTPRRGSGVLGQAEHSQDVQALRQGVPAEHGDIRGRTVDPRTWSNTCAVRARWQGPLRLQLDRYRSARHGILAPQPACADQPGAFTHANANAGAPPPRPTNPDVRSPRPGSSWSGAGTLPGTDRTRTDRRAVFRDWFMGEFGRFWPTFGSRNTCRRKREG